MSAHPLRAGFTAIEMLAVLGVIVVLSGMAGLAVVPAMRKGKVNEAANAIVDVARQARRLAMQRARPADDAHYGIVIAYESASDTTYVALIRGDGGKPASECLLLGADGLPVMRHDLAKTVAVHLGDLELRDASTTEIAWYAQYRTGMPLGVNAGRLSDTPVEIGTKPPTRPEPPLVGAPSGAPTAGEGPSVVAPTLEDVPGLSLRSLDDRVRRAIAVYASGVLTVEEF